MLYERPSALTDELSRRRLFSPWSYGPVRGSQIVPIVAAEAFVLASLFPVVWQLTGDRATLVTVRSLLAGGHGDRAAIGLPLLCQAYPFTPPSGAAISDNDETPRYIDDTFADQPTDQGAPVFMPDGRLSKATVMRFAALDEYTSNLAATEAISAHLLSRSAFDDWPLSFDVEGQKLELNGLAVVKRSAFDDGTVASLTQYGPECGLLLGLHRVSLFRAGQLLAAARSVILHKPVPRVDLVELEESIEP